METGGESTSDISLQSHGKQISLQLHADAARVTSVSLQGNRLIVQIEAELEPTHIDPASLRSASIPVSKPEPVPAPSKPAEPLQMAPTLPALPLVQPQSRTTFTLAGTLADLVSRHTTSVHRPNESKQTPPVPKPEAEERTDSGQSLLPDYEVTEKPGASVPPSFRASSPAPTAEKDTATTKKPTAVIPREAVDTAVKAEAAPTTEPSAEPPAMEPPPPEAAPPPFDSDAPPMIDELKALPDADREAQRHSEPKPAVELGDELGAGAAESPSPSPFDASPSEGLSPAGMSPDAATEESKPEPVSTTIHIRYTCPKCGQQGTQEAGKMGTVATCSNCGKAMRLVMRK